MIPSASDLTYFVEVAHTLNLSRASERLGIKQPSLTLSIQRLENNLGVKLLSRSKRGVLLTQAGKQLLAHSKSLLHSWGQVKALTQASVHEIQGTYTIGCHPSVGLYTLSNFLPRLLSEYPNLDIQLKHNISRKITEAVISSDIDIGIVVNPVQHPDLIIHKLSDDKFSLWTNSSIDNPANYCFKNNVLIHDPSLLQSQIILNVLKKEGRDVNRAIATSNLEVIADLTAKGCGIECLPSRVAKRMGNLNQVPGAPECLDEICLLYRMENKNIKSIQTLSAAIRNSFNEM